MIFDNYKMNNKLIRQVDQYITDNSSQSRHIRFSSQKTKMAIKNQRKVFQRKLFGQHYNYSKVGLNKEKKYMIQQQKNTQIQRANRLLLEKIQKIAKRSGPNQRRRIFTEHQDLTFHSEKQNSINARQFNPSSKSFNNLNKVEGQKSARIQLKIFFQGSMFIQEQIILIKTYIENSKFTIEVDYGKMKQKIALDIESYRIFFKEKLDSDHSKILKHLTFNGKLIELKGFKTQNIVIQQEHGLTLPPITLKSGSTQNIHKKQHKDSHLEQRQEHL